MERTKQKTYSRNVSLIRETLPIVIDLLWPAICPDVPSTAQTVPAAGGKSFVFSADDHISCDGRVCPVTPDCQVTQD